MIDYSRICTCFDKIVAYRASDDDCIDPIAADLTGSTCNTFVTDVPGVSLTQIADALPANYTDYNVYLRDIRQQ